MQECLSKNSEKLYLYNGDVVSGFWAQANNIPEQLEFVYEMEIAKFLEGMSTNVNTSLVESIAKKELRDKEKIERIYSEAVDWNGVKEDANTVDAKNIYLLEEVSRSEKFKVPEVDGQMVKIPKEKLEKISKTMSSDRIKNISKQGRNTIKSIVVNGRLNNETPYDISKRIGEHIGLNGRQEQALWNYRKRLEKKGTSGIEIENKISKKKNEYYKYRARMIATTETTRIDSESKLATWDKMHQDGIIDYENYGKKWVAVLDTKTSKICRSLDGEIVGMAKAKYFVDPEGKIKAIIAPPAHVNCRSRLIIVRL